MKTGDWSTTSVNTWLAAGFTPLEAVMVRLYGPAPPVGVPAMVAVPLAWATKVTPLGRAPVLDSVGGNGKPVVVTVKVPACPVVKVTVLALVIAGAWSTVRVNA